jgi:hypothetical protein
MGRDQHIIDELKTAARRQCWAVRFNEYMEQTGELGVGYIRASVCCPQKPEACTGSSFPAGAVFLKGPGSPRAGRPCLGQVFNAGHWMGSTQTAP